MADTIREQIISAIETKVAEVLTAKGYNTGIGANVFRALARLDPDDAPCIVIWPGEEAVDSESRDHAVTMNVHVEGFKEYGDSNPSEVYEAILGDLIDAVVGRKWTLPFTAGAEEIEAGDSIEGQTSGATALVEAVSVSSGSWAGGDAAGNLTLRRKSGTFSSETLDIVGGAVGAADTTGVSGTTGPEASACGDLADDIRYAGSGGEPGTEAGDTITGVSAVFEIRYRTAIGDPYTQ